MRAQEKPVIRIGTIPTEIAAAVYYARELGYFAKAGFDVTIAPITNGAAVSAAVLSGALDIGFSNPVSLTIAHDRGLPIAILAGAGVHDAKAPTNGIMTVAAASAIKSAKDLAGKTIAVSGLANITNLSARSWLDKNGGDSKASKYIEIPLPQMAGDVLSGHVDAATMDAAGNEATASAQFRTLGSSFDAIASRFLASLWFTTNDYVQKHPAEARAFAGIVRQASAWANDHPHDAVAIYAKNSKYNRRRSRERAPPDFCHVRDARSRAADDRRVGQIRHDQSRVSGQGFYHHVPCLEHASPPQSKEFHPHHG